MVVTFVAYGQAISWRNSVDVSIISSSFYSIPIPPSNANPLGAEPVARKRSQATAMGTPCAEKSALCGAV